MRSVTSPVTDDERLTALVSSVRTSFPFNHCGQDLHVTISQTASFWLLTHKAKRLPLLSKKKKKTTKRSSPGVTQTSSFILLPNNNNGENAECAEKQALCGEHYLRKHKEMHHHQTIMWAHYHIVPLGKKK